VNFGGGDESQNESNALLKVWAAGIYVIPPDNGAELPGKILFS